MNKAKNTTKNNYKSNRNTKKNSKSKKINNSDQWITALKKTWTVAIISLIGFTTLFSFIPKQSAESLTAKYALVYGDSLGYEAAGAIAAQFATKSGWTYQLHSQVGYAVCDWIDELQNDVAINAPQVVTLETAGNALRNCMSDRNGGSAPLIGSIEWANLYRQDLNEFFSIATNAGSKVVFVKPPAMYAGWYNTAINQLISIATEEAGKFHGISISGSPRSAVTLSGKFTFEKNCLANETAALGCGTDGKITIRSEDGLHFCPTGLNSGLPSGCSVYSSGASRWGKALTNTTVNPPAPVLP